MNIYRRHFLSIVALTAVIQTVIILYNHSTGFFTIQTISEFVFRLMYGTFFASPVAIAIVLIDEQMVRLLDRRIPWENGIYLRTGIETASAAGIGAALGAIITAVVHAISPYHDGLLKNVMNNMLITAVLNLIIAAIVEAVIAYCRSAEAKAKAERLEREFSRIRFETLKTQLNPHFMFISLNVLSSLLRKDSGLAERFIGEFANVYRYTLDVIDQPVVELSRELEFTRSYLYLLQIRFSDSVSADITIASEHLSLLIPPLAIQTAVENAFKHNIVSEETPLRISILSRGSTIVVTNNIRPKQRTEESKGGRAEQSPYTVCIVGGE